MNWEDFFAGKISVYCGGPTGAEQFLDECDAHGIPTRDQRRKLRGYGTSHFAYRYNGKILVVFSCSEDSWNGQLGCGSVTEVLRYADIQSKSVQIDTLDGLL